MKTVYSINRAAYIYMDTGIEPELELIRNNGKCLVRFIFPDCDAVNLAVDAYLRDQGLQTFLHTYRELRQQINEAREEP